MLKRFWMKILKIKKRGPFIVLPNSIFAQWSSCANSLNFGDCITPYLISASTGKKATRVSRKSIRRHYVMAGSIITCANSSSIVFGTGIMNREDKLIEKPKEIIAVRGPLTRETLLKDNILCPEIYGDPGILLPYFYKPKFEKENIVGIIPHYVDFNYIRKNVKDEKYLIINILDEVENVIDSICKCNLIFSSSLHGIIVSHTYGIPALWVKFSNLILGGDTKYQDYYLSLNMKDMKPVDFSSKKLDMKQLCYESEQNRDFLLPNQDLLNNMRKNLYDVYPFKV